MRSTWSLLLFLVACGGEPGGRMRITPEVNLDIDQNGEVGRVTIENLGDSTLIIRELDIKGPSDEDHHPSIDDFKISGCDRLPCSPGINLCSQTVSDCASSLILKVEYDDNDGSPNDRAKLRILTNDPTDALHNLLIRAGPP